MRIEYTEDDLRMIDGHLEEFDDHLESMEENILSLEDWQDDETVNSIFRSLHTIKGTTGFIKLNHIKDLSHVAEYLVDDIRKGLFPVTSEIVNVLLNTLDMLKTMFQQLKNAIRGVKQESRGLYAMELADLPFEPLIRTIKDLRENSTRQNEEAEGKSPSSKIIVPKLEKEEALQFIKIATKAIESLKLALPGYKSESSLKKITQGMRLLQDLGTKYEFKAVLIELESLDNLFSFLNNVEGEMAETLQNSIRDSLRTLSQLVNHPQLIKEPKRDPSLRTRATDKEEYTSIRVPGNRLDVFMNLIGELKIRKDLFQTLTKDLRQNDQGVMSQKVKETGAAISRIADELENSIMEIRMIPVKTVFSRFPRMVRDLSEITGKRLRLSMEGEDTELDKSVVEKISDPLTHLIRNCADHAIESAAERENAKKPEIGSIVLKAFRQGQHVTIQVEDDGRGISRDAVGKKAVRKGLITKEHLQSMKDEDIFNLIMIPGFSTAEKITEVSGRGVGMDVVKTNIEQIGGKISISSAPGEGTTVSLFIPLTLNVTNGLEIACGGERFIIPLDIVVETAVVPETSIRTFNGEAMLSHRNEVLKLIRLHDLFKLEKPSDVSRGFSKMVLLNLQSRIVALEVDGFFREEEIVVKSLEENLGKIEAISGASIKSNGSVVLVINPDELMRLAC